MALAAAPQKSKTKNSSLLVFSSTNENVHWGDMTFKLYFGCFHSIIAWASDTPTIQWPPYVCKSETKATLRLQALPGPSGLFPRKVNNISLIKQPNKQQSICRQCSLKKKMRVPMYINTIIIINLTGILT